MLIAVRCCLLLVAAACLASSDTNPKVSHIQLPRRGGLNGETRIIIFGSEFDTTLEISSSSSSKEVHFVSDLKSYECKIHVAESDEGQVVCYTSAMDPGSYYLKLKQYGTFLPPSGYCDNSETSDKCKIDIYDWRTPKLQYFNPAVTPPQQLIEVSGRIYTNLTDSTQAQSSNGMTSSIRRAYSSSGKVCNLIDPSTSEPFGVSLNSETSYWGKFSCMLEGTFIGYQNLSFIVDEDFGRSLALPTAIKVSANNRLYMFQTYAGVTAISPSEGSVNGGTRLTISGRHFYSNSQAPAQVWVGGEPCTVESVSDDGTELTCRTEKQPTNSINVFKGGQGVQFDIFTNQNDVDGTLSETANGVESHILGSTKVENLQYNNSQTAVSRMRGLFIPSTTSNHQFFVKADSEVRFLFNPNGNDASGATSTLSWTNSETIRRYSHFYSLTAGQEYYFEVRHLESGGSANIDVGVYVEKTNYSPQQTSQSVSDKQTIQLSSTVVKEVQTLSFSNWGQQNAAVKSEWTVTLLCTQQSCTGYYFRLTLFGISTDDLEYNVEASAVAVALNGLLPLASSQETVDVNATTTGYEITFNSNRGHMELTGSTSSPALTITTQVAVTGKPQLDTFTIKLNEQISESLPIAATESQVADAVKKLFGASCPNQLGSSLGYAAKIYNFEDGLVQSGELTSTESFCGIFSVMNPNIIFHNTNEKYDLTLYAHVCFAYKGDIANSLVVQFTYFEGQNFKETETTFSAVGLNKTNEWQHFCYNLQEKISRDYPTASRIKIGKVAVSKGSSSNDDLFLDNIFFGTTYLSEAQRKEYMKRRVSSAVSSIKLESVAVTKTGSDYTVTFTPIDCGNSFPLIGFGFASSENAISNSEHEYTFGSSGPQIRVQRTAAASPPMTGDFDLSFEDIAYETLSGLSASIEEEELKNELETLEKITNVEVVRTGTCYGYGWTVKFVTPTGKYPLMMVNTNRLLSQPDAPTADTRRVNLGGLRMDPIYADWFRTVHSTPQVQVQIDQVLSRCEGTSCGFQWSDAATPQVTNINPSLSLVPDAEVTILGTGFSTTSSKIEVRIGGVKCLVTEATVTEINCTVGNSPSGNQPVSVRVDDKGFASLSASLNQVQVSGTVTSISPTTGSSRGGTRVTITGTGFSSMSTVMIGGSSCKVATSTVTYTTLTCTTQSSNAQMANVEVTTGGVAVTSSQQYQYVNPTASVTAVSASTLVVTGGEVITITGSGFGTVEGSVLIGEVSAKVNSWSESSIEIISPQMSSGVYSLNVNIASGFVSSSQSVTYDLSVTNVGSLHGSFSGGTQLIISGSGFAAPSARKRRSTSTTTVLNVTVCERPCPVVGEVTSTQFICLTPPSGETRYVVNTGEHPTLGIGYQWNETTIKIRVGDSVDFRWSVPRFVTTKIGLQTGNSSSSTTYNNNGFIVAPTVSGHIVHQFNLKGTTYLNSGCLNGNCALVMRATVVVSEPNATLCKVKFTTINGEVKKNVVTQEFRYDKSDTPKVSDISPNEGTTNTEIQIKGTNFKVSPDKPIVKIGEKNCDVKSNSATNIVCSVSETANLEVDVRHFVEVKFGVGNALIEIANREKRTFVLRPLMTSVQPTSGSTEGGTVLTITGSGFKEGVYAMIDNQPVNCKVQSVSYSEIKCETSRGINGVRQEVTLKMPNERIVKCDPSCEYTRSDYDTPTVDSVTIGSNYANLEINLKGSGFGTSCNNVTVTLVDEGFSGTTTSCRASSCNTTEITCLINGRFPAGPNTLSLHVSGKGKGKFSNASHAVITNPAELYSLEPDTGSLAGGTTLEVRGNGFLPGDATVFIGDTPCNNVNVSADKSTLTCTTAAADTFGRYNVTIVSNRQKYGVRTFHYSSSATPTVSNISVESGNVVLRGKNFGSDPSKVKVKLGGVECTVEPLQADTIIRCNPGNGEGGRATVTVEIDPLGLAQIQTNVLFSYPFDLTDVLPSSGSYGGGQNITITGNGFSQNTIVTVCGNPCELVLVTATAYVCITAANSDVATGSTSCHVRAKNSGGDAMLQSGYTYTAALTPTINSVTPDRGGTGGGTAITIIGTDFGLSPTVTIDGSICDVKSSTTTSISCVTNSHQGSIRTKVSVAVDNNGIATQENADFFYIDRWSSVFTWGGASKPAAGEFVIIQKGQTVLLDDDTPVLKMLLIDGGELIFDEKEVQLNAENILITKGGLMQVGTEEKPFQSKAEVVMHGHLLSPELPIYGAKTLGVRNGTLDLHGRPIAHTWTLLAATAKAGDSQIMVQHPVFDWQVGDEIVIATTGLRHSQKETETKTITGVSVSNGQSTITLNEPLKYQHLGVTETFDGTKVEFRAEVGLLTRNIKFRGSNEASWNQEITACPDGFDTGEFVTQTCFQGRFGEETGSDQFGASIMMHSALPNSPDIMARIENVELTYVGQAFRLGRYPIHWHLMGNVSGMYVRRNAIHKTFNRAVTIHGTHNLLVEHNVVYNVMGGAIFIEDGIETENIIQYNLAVFVRQSTSLLNDDVTPAAYWVTNPNNILRHNHAAGGTHFGFWYRMHEHPDGPSFTPSVCPRKVELGEFKNNTVHSQGWFGIWIFQDYKPVKGGRCEKGAEWVNGGALQFIDFVLVDNEKAGIDLKLILETPWGLEKGAGIVRNTIVGHSGLVLPNYECDKGIVLPFAPGLTVKDTKMVNFDRGGVAFGVTFIDGTCTNLCGGFYSHFSGMSFSDVTKRVVWRWEHEAVLLDVDGTLTNSAAGSSLLPQSQLLGSARCTVQSGDMFSSNPKFPSAICPPDFKLHRIALNQPLPSSLEGNNLIFENDFGQTSILYAKKRLTHKAGWMGLLPDGDTFLMFWENGEQFTNLTYNARVYDFVGGNKIIIQHRLPQTPDVIETNGTRIKLSEANNNALDDSSRNLDWHFDSASRLLQIQLSNDDTSRRKRALIEVNDPNYKHIDLSPNIYRCFYDDCLGPVEVSEEAPTSTKPSTASNWSNQTNACVDISSNGESITVLKEADGVPCWVVVDVDEITTTNLTVLGTMHIEDNDVTIKATYIAVLGGRIFTKSSERNYYEKQLIIELQGQHSTQGWALPGVELGSKALGCFGGCDFFGKPHSVYWTHLDTTVTPGATTITLQDRVNWAIGDEIVITTTSYNVNETEVCTITAITDRKTITVSPALTYRHLGETYTVGTKTFDMRAEVGLLTRNIKIIGANYDNIDTELFGARVLVGALSSGSGWGRFSNVEFMRTGQEGWTERWDPRFSLAWLNTGSTTEARPSFVTGCSFHHGYSTAIGIFGADQVNVTDNVVHHTIHDGIRVTGQRHRIEKNLVTVTLTRASYGNRFDTTTFKDWQASFELSEASNLILVNNTAAGSERVGFHLDGEACDAPAESAYSGNVAHGTLHGIHIFTEDGISPCTMIRNFLIYKAWDYGIYQQISMNILVKDTIIVDSTVGYIPLFFGPPALGHVCVEKSARLENVACVGRSKDFDPTLDSMDERNDKNLLIRAFGPDRSAPRNHFSGSTCILLPTFASAPNGAPFKPLHGLINYPALCGLLNITGLHAHAYKSYPSENNRRDLVFADNPNNEDIFHPTLLRHSSTFDVEEKSKAFIRRPSLGKINPSDCVDMECDGRKKVLIKDEDGSFIGGGAAGAIIPQAEFEWDGDPRRGLGDYRIPTALLSDASGTKMAINQVVSHRGIIGTGNCIYMDDWQCYKCSGAGTLDYQMLVIESLDGDTETRRLSPVALLGDKYIDLNNGPQDHGWCSGYTCQKRISTFYTIVATGKHFDLYFTGYAPEKLRLRLLNVDNTKTIRLAIWYARPQRLDVYRNSSLYIHPQNSVYNQTTGKWVLRPADSDNPRMFEPAIDSQIHGSNWMDIGARLLYVTLRGKEPVDIITVSAIIVKIGFPALSVEEFFGEQLSSNLASYLGISSDKIRVVKVVRETSARKRRDTSSGTVTYTIMYTDLEDGASYDSPAARDTAIEELNRNAATLVVAYQNKTLSRILGVDPSSFETAPISSDLTQNVSENYFVVYKIPRSLSVTSLPSTVEEYLEFPQQVNVTLLDENGEAVATMANTFSVTATLDKSGASADPAAQLLGTTTVTFENDTAHFTNLLITHEGEYNLRFEITNPAGVNLNTVISSVVVTQRTVQAAFINGVPDHLPHNGAIDLIVELQNSRGQRLPAVGYKGHTWKADVSLDDPENYAPTTISSQNTTFEFDTSSARITTTGLYLAQTENFHRYNIRFRIYTEPAKYDFTNVTTSILFADSFPSLPARANVKFVLGGTPYLQRNSISSQTTFTTNLHNILVSQINAQTQRISDFTVSPNGGDTEVTFTMNGFNRTVAINGINDLRIFIQDGRAIYNGVPLAFSTTGCPITIDGDCQDGTDLSADVTSSPATPSESADGLDAWVFVVIGIATATVLAAGIIAAACVLKRAKSNKIRHHGKGCLDAESSRGSTPFADSLGRSSDFETPTSDSRMGNYGYVSSRSRLTPVAN